MRRRGFILAVALLPCKAWAHSMRAGDIAIGHAWALPNIGGESQVFFPLVNQSAVRDELVAARSDICEAITFHKDSMHDASALASIPLEPGRPVAMRPAGRHLRLMGLKRPLAEEDRFMLVLGFHTAGEIEIEVFVEGRPSD